MIKKLLFLLLALSALKIGETAAEEALEEEEEVLVPIRREVFVAKTNTTTVAFEDYSRLTKRRVF